MITIDASDRPLLMQKLKAINRNTMILTLTIIFIICASLIASRLIEEEIIDTSGA